MKFTDKSKWQTGAKEEAAPTRSKVIINEPDFIAQVMLKSSQNNIFCHRGASLNLLEQRERKAIKALVECK
jgi:hypothetical protein